MTAIMNLPIPIARRLGPLILVHRSTLVGIHRRNRRHLLQISHTFLPGKVAMHSLHHLRRAFQMDRAQRRFLCLLVHPSVW